MGLEKLFLRKKMRYKKSIFPFYHTVSDQDLPYIRHLYPLKNIDQFQRELDFFQQHYTSISLQELIESKNSQEGVRDNCFHLSFDDGLKECHTIIAPILKERGLHATFFINPNFIDNQAVFYRYKVALLLEKNPSESQRNKLLNLQIHDEPYIDSLIEQHKITLSDWDIYMNMNELQDLLDNGFSLGGHSMNHPLYQHLNVNEQLKESRESVDFIQQNFGLDYRVFSFPFTDFGVKQDFFENFDAQLTFGTAGIKDDSVATNIQRLPMDNCLGNPSYFVLKNVVSYWLKKSIHRETVQHF